MESFERILTNCDVLQSIFDYLDFKDHLKLMKICSQFEFAVAHGVWRLKYKNLRLWPLMETDDAFLLQYNTENNVMTECPLTSEEIHTILQHSSMYINKLELLSVRCLENLMAFNYHNLKELTFRDTVIKDVHLQQVAENCINLQSFSLDISATPIKKSNIHANSNIFGKMKALNRLKILGVGAWNYFDVQQLFCLPHLKTLIIHVDINDSNLNNGNINKNITDRVYNIENLTIGTLRNQQSAKVCFMEDLKRFENLTKLSITSNPISFMFLNCNDLTQINNGCPKLCELSFTDCHFSFKEFPRMNNLMHLTFDRCWHMTMENFDEIFRKLKIKSFSFIRGSVRDKSEDIYNYNNTSNTLETLNLQDILDRSIVTTLFNRQHKFENVSKARLSMDYDGEQSTELCLSHNFPNLQELIMFYFYISSEDILYLKNLKVLEFNLFDNMSWSYLEILFKHPTLTHITVTAFDCRNFEKYFERCTKSCEGLTTILEYLSLPEEVYVSGLSFWPSFRQRNKLLKLEVVYY